MWIALTVFSLVCGTAAALAAGSGWRRRAFWFLPGAVFGPVGVLLAYVASDDVSIPTAVDPTR